jgi:hypothetical protein
MKKKAKKVRNPFYADIQRNGIIIDVPVKSLPHGKRGISNPYYARIMSEGGVRIGRPRREEKARPTVVKSVRLPPEIWKRVQQQAEREGIPLNAAMRQAALIWLQS